MARDFLLKNIFLKTIRDNLAPALAWGTGVALIVAVGATQYGQIISGVGADRQRMIAEATKALQAFSFLTGEVNDISTIGGFLTARVLGFIPLMFALWAAVVGVGLVRGEEQNGALDVLLSTPHSRGRVLAHKVAGLGALVALVMALLGTGLWVGIMAAGESIPAADMLSQLLNTGSLVAFWGMLGLFVGQLVLVRRSASAITGGILFATYFLNNIVESTPGLEWVAWLTPFHYYSLSKPLVVDRDMVWGAWMAIMIAIALLAAFTAYIFNRRDIGSVFSVFPARAGTRKRSAGSTRMLGSVFSKAIGDLMWPSIWWGVGLAVYAVMILGTVNQALGPVRDLIKNMGWMAQIVGDMATPAAYMSYSLFTFSPVLLAIFAITQIENWSSDEEEGRLELPVGMPLPRWQHLTARYIAITLAIIFILALTGLAIMLGATGANVSLDMGRVWVGLAVNLPMGLVVAAFGLCVAAWLKRPGTALPITIAVVTVMFFLELFAPILSLSEAVRSISIFYLYGKPLTEGVNAGGMLALSLATVLLFAGGIMGFERRDIAK
jgi:ABC-2 type transport system permease protein